MQLHGADVTYGALEWSKQTRGRTSSARKRALRTPVPRFATQLYAPARRRRTRSRRPDTYLVSPARSEAVQRSVHSAQRTTTRERSAARAGASRAAGAPAAPPPPGAAGSAVLGRSRYARTATPGRRAGTL